MSEEQTKAAENVYVLRRPFTFEEQEITELHLDFMKLSGDDILAIERRILNEGHPMPLVKETSKTFQAYVAAAAAGVQVELIKKLPAKDFSAVTLLAQDFLLL